MLPVPGKSYSYENGMKNISEQLIQKDSERSKKLSQTLHTQIERKQSTDKKKIKFRIIHNENVGEVIGFVGEQKQVKRKSCENRFDRLRDVSRDNNRHYENIKAKIQEGGRENVGTRHFNKSFYGKLKNLISEKPISFYKFGLKEHEKKQCKTVFSQLFKIQSNNLKGTLSIGQLWDSKTSIRYLKQNSMFMNKETLLKQFKSIQKEQKMKKKALLLKKQQLFVEKYRQILCSNIKNCEKSQKLQNIKQLTQKQACRLIRSQIQSLIDNKIQKSMGSQHMMDKLQRNYEMFDRIATQYRNKMVVYL